MVPIFVARGSDNNGIQHVEDVRVEGSRAFSSSLVTIVEAIRREVMRVIKFEDSAVVKRLSKVRMSGVVECVVVCSASSNVNTEIMPVPVEIRFDFFKSYFMCSLLACC